jgi:hypothetical protein
MRESESFANSCLADACAQGRRPCPCPDACRIPEGVSVDWIVATAGIALLSVAGIVVAVFA